MRTCDRAEASNNKVVRSLSPGTLKWSEPISRSTDASIPLIYASGRYSSKDGESLVTANRLNLVTREAASQRLHQFAVSVRSVLA